MTPPKPAHCTAAAIAVFALLHAGSAWADDSVMNGTMAGSLGAYAMTRDASGTSWQPDASEHAGLHGSAGAWMLMGHARLNAIEDWQQGPRGDRETYLSGMLMGVARRAVHDDGDGGGDLLQLRAMFSPDPFNGKRGLPLLLQTGETADGQTPLVDRQHPHDLVMELSASYAHALTARDSIYLYAGLPGEPAFGPPAFMHRQSIADSPEPPISHHWLDSTHIVFGVVTAGVVHEGWKLEVSRFRGREPDQYRFNIETGPLDSTAARLSWNPARALALQVSWADVMHPEQLRPDENQRKWSASAIVTKALPESHWWSTTVAWGRRSAESGWLDAVAVESALNAGRSWTLFARGERIDNDELPPLGGVAGMPYTVGKVSVGAVHDFPYSGHIRFGVGGLFALNFVPAALESAYGGRTPKGVMLFLRLKVE